MNFSPFQKSKNQNQLTQGQIWFLIISKALKQSLSFYQLQWKPSQKSPNEPNSNNEQPILIQQSCESGLKRLQEKQRKQVHQNKKSIKKISYNSYFQKNDKKEQKCLRNQINLEEKVAQDEQKELKTSFEYRDNNKQKIIHQYMRKYMRKQTQNYKNKMIKSKNIVHLEEVAFIPHNTISSEQIQHKKHKLLMRKVLNWKQIDKKIIFRKMELKKLLG